MSTADSSLDAYLDAHHEERLESLLELLRIPSISALPEHAGDCRAAAERIAADLQAAGVEHVEVSETGGHPIVYGDWLHAPDAPTILIYAHYDVQPVDPIELWTTAPFDPFVEDGRLVGRGSADDKSQVHLHVRAAEALLAVRGKLPVNVKYVFEGEEESSSVHLEGWLEANRDRLASDLAIISDTGFFDGNLPAITVSLRGLMYAQVDVELSPVDLHSGSYGGAVGNPANALAVILASLKGPDGRIRVAGFYDDVVALTVADREASAALPFDEEAFRVSIPVPALTGEAGFTTLERRGARPTLDVNGLWGGFTGEGSKTIIPAHAHAKVSCRLVADQEPDKIFELLKAHVESVAPPSVRVSVRYLGGGSPSRTPIDHPAMRAATRSIEAVFGRSPLFIREGGSIPICASFERVLGLPVVLYGFANQDCRAHAPNEFMILENYELGIRAVARLFDELGPMKAELEG